eukprot:Colp12_sorted_trinity150504_noHs@10331
MLSAVRSVRSYAAGARNVMREAVRPLRISAANANGAKDKPFNLLDTFERRHIGPRTADLPEMLKVAGASTMEELIAKTVPAGIRLKRELDLEEARSESELLAHFKSVMGQNKVYRSYIGMGYYNTIVPNVILRNILENPGWYTQYTPYQAEISQGRLESLLNYQTMVSDLTGMDFANASLLDEGTAAAEAAALAFSTGNRKKKKFYVDANTHPQTLALIKTRCEPFEMEVVVKNSFEEMNFEGDDVCGVLVSYPNSNGEIHDYKDLSDRAHKKGALVIVATDLLALTVLKPPSEFGADIALGSAQRLGVPLGYGGPHAAFFAVNNKLVRKMPGRIVGVSRDSHGNPAFRLTLQTREQHIRREKATSNICTISAAPWGSAAILPISWAYIKMMGGAGLRRATEAAILNANYMAARLRDHYPILYTGANGFVAHEFILDPRDLTEKTGVQAVDIAKRLQDYGFHSPTMSWPVANTLMVEPTESESKAELDRFVDALISIRQEIREIEEGKADRKDNVLKNAPHTAQHLLTEKWEHQYSREKAAYPLPYLRRGKFWPSTGRIDDVFGDRNLVCACPPMSDYQN